MRFHSLALALLLCGAACLPSSAAAADSTVDGNTTFAFDLYAKLKGGDGNLFFSPYSISSCLAMVYAGARGETQLEMARALHFGTNQTEFHRAFGKLQDDLNLIPQKSGIDFHVANGLWKQKGLPFQAPFLDIATKQYGANVAEVDFQSHPDLACEQINDWVKTQTKGIIPAIIAPENLDNRTDLILANAVYFKGQWRYKFVPRETAPQPFYVASGKKVNVPMMHQTALSSYADLDSLRLLELSYMDNRLSMVILLPKDPDGIGALEKQLNAKRFSEWLDQKHSTQVHVYLPKFKFTQEYDLSSVLPAMGMKTAFSSSLADFSGLDGKRILWIQRIEHKAFVAVDETGTEAAAATTVALTHGEPKPPEIFLADHPFLFLIRDTQSGTILFLGRVTNPTK